MAYWARTGVLIPSILFSSEKQPYGYIYDFVDLVGLRTLASLRDVHDLPLQQLRKAYSHLRAHADRPWSDLRFWVRGKELFFSEPVSHGLLTPGIAQQMTVPIEIEPVVTDVQARIGEMQKRKPDAIGKIERHRYIQHNQPVVSGTRVPVESILDLASEGYGVEDIVSAFPSLTPQDVVAILHATAA
jgi:uncharacterized protein (DUF433 family)